MNILRPCDVENEVRLALVDYFNVDVPPIPKSYPLPHLLIKYAGGNSGNEVDTFLVSINARAETEADASDYLRTALGALEVRSREQFGALRNVVLNSLASWGTDPVRPDLKLCTALVLVTAHREPFTIPES